MRVLWVWIDGMPYDQFTQGVDFTRATLHCHEGDAEWTPGPPPKVTPAPPKVAAKAKALAKAKARAAGRKLF